MDNVKEILIAMGSVTIFCIAISVSIYMNSLLNRELELVAEQNYKQHVLYEEYIE
ncbi:MAG TPA: hypothetical protein VHQ24_05430 [Lachnospiraceae bacterium]|nr:hypothetical protein [Lachnospiraceae bacterium]